MADRDPVQPIHQPVLPVFEEEEVWVRHAAERFEDAAAEDLLAWALERFHPAARDQRGRRRRRDGASSTWRGG